MEREINKLNEVINLLNIMRQKHIGVNLLNIQGEKILTGYITKSDTNSISIYYDSIPDTMPLKSLAIAFDNNGMFYKSSNTDLRNLSLQLKSVEINNPESIFTHPMRKFTRVELPEQAIKLHIKQIAGESLVDSNTPKLQNTEGLPPSLRGIYEELSQEQPDLKKILEMVKEELVRYSSRFKINNFKDIKNLAPLEKVVFVFKKTFFIGDTDSLKEYVHLGEKYNLIGYEKYFEMIKKTLSPDIMEQIRNSYVSRNISSYCMVPILIGDRVSGVIEVTVPSDDGKFKKLSIYDVFYIKGLADILGEVFVKLKMSGSSEENELRVIDISMGGILANTKNIYIARSFKPNAAVKLNIAFGEGELDANARIVRYDYIPGDNAGLNVAFEFIGMDENAKAELGKHIRKFLKATIVPPAEKKEA